jgi:anti-anti-sigma regulatory factor
MFRKMPSETVALEFADVRSSTVIHLKDHVWNYAKLPNLKSIVDGTPNSRVILDLACVHQMTSAAFAMLLLMKRRLQQRGLEVCIHGLHGQPKLLCSILKLNDLLFNEKEQLRFQASR